MSATIVSSENPYVGPRPFEAGRRLYGRDHEVEALVDLLIVQPVVLLHSPSGAGKTSLIQAALLRRLEAMKLVVRPLARLRRPPPNGALGARHGVNRYALSVLQDWNEHAADRDRLAVAELAELSLAGYLARAQATNGAYPPDDDEDDNLAPIREVLIIDQFEELLTLDSTDVAEKQAFVGQLAEVLAVGRRRLLLALREEYLPALEPLLRVLPRRLRTTMRLELLSANAARAAIQGPAREAGVDFTDAAARKLVDDLCREWALGPDGKPVPRPGLHVEPVQLQVVCRRLWDKPTRAPDRIVEDDVEAVGDVDSALGDYYAESVVAVARQEHIDEGAIRDWFEHKLLLGHGVRGQVLREARSSGGLPNTVVDALTNAHLVRAEERRGATWYELAHDRLIQPIVASNDAWRLGQLTAFQRLAVLWDRAGRPTAQLLEREALAEAERWASVHRLDPTEEAFLFASREAREAAARALAEEAERLYEEAAEEEQQAIQRLFVRLARDVDEPPRGEQATHTPRAWRLDELTRAAAEEPALARAAVRYAAANLLTLTPTPADSASTVRLTEPRVFDWWPRWRAWVADAIGRQPFRGLLAFRAEDREYFFGRDELVRKLVLRLQDHPFLAVVGSSGSGKSSLVHAGLVPTLQTAEPALQTTNFTPASEPMAQWSAAVARLGDGPALVVVDQFEEVFTLCHDEAERARFIGTLLAATPLRRVVVTMRADFWGDCARYPALGAALDAHGETIAPLTPSDLARVIEKQADAAGLRLEPGLLDELLADVAGEAGAMPLVQHALLELWRQRAGRVLPRDAYRRMNGIRGAIAKTANDLFASLSPEEQQRAREIFVRLAQFNDEAGGEQRPVTPRRVRLAELASADRDAAGMHALVARLADARLLVVGKDAATEEELVEIAHESLLTYWTTLRDWLWADRQNLRLRQSIRRQAADWLASGRHPDLLLLQGHLLAQAETLGQREAYLNDQERTYLDASIARRDREVAAEEERRQRELSAARAQARLRTIIAILAGLLALGAILLAALAFILYQRAQAEADRAVVVTEQVRTEKAHEGRPARGPTRAPPHGDAAAPEPGREGARAYLLGRSSPRIHGSLSLMSAPPLGGAVRPVAPRME